MSDDTRSTYRKLTEVELANIADIKGMGECLIRGISALPLGGAREFAIAKTKVEEAVMWAVKGVTGGPA